VLIFFLLHELPRPARERVLAEAVRVIRPGGRLVITEYAPLPRHWLYRVSPCRGLSTRLEPFLADFWRHDLEAMLQEKAWRMGKIIRCSETHSVFHDFYRVSVYTLEKS